MILDKSVMQGTSRQRIAEGLRGAKAVISDVLFFEVMSADEPGRSRCLGKLAGENVRVAPHVGGLLRHEIENRTSCGRPSLHSEGFEIEIAADLNIAAYVPSPNQQQVIEEENDRIAKDVQVALVKAAMIPTIFPAVAKGSNQEREAARKEAVARLSGKSVAVLEVYESIPKCEGRSELPPASIIDETWVIYRWIQAQLLLALDIHVRYPWLKSGNAVPVQVEHSVIDSQYAILASLEGGLLTRDKGLADLYSAMDPGGILWREVVG